MLAGKNQLYYLVNVHQMVQLEENGSKIPPALTWRLVANVTSKKPTAEYQEDGRSSIYRS